MLGLSYLLSEILDSVLSLLDCGGWHGTIGLQIPLERCDLFSELRYANGVCVGGRKLGDSNLADHVWGRGRSRGGGRGGSHDVILSGLMS